MGGGGVTNKHFSFLRENSRVSFNVKSFLDFTATRKQAPSHT